MSIWTRLFNRKQSLARTSLVQMELGRPVQTPRNYEAFAKEGYQINVIAYKCVSIISRASAGIKWNLFTQRTGMSEKVEIENHPLLSLIKAPNPMQAQSAFFESLIAYYMISGNTYVEAVGPSPTAAPMELWTVRPDKMRIIPGKTGIPLAYEFNPNTSSTIVFPVDQISGDSQILHMKTFHPTDNWYGMSPIESAMYSIDQHNTSGEWNLGLLQNSATPSGVVTIKEDAMNPMGVLPGTEQNNFKEQLKQKVSGAKNAGRILVLEGGMDWKQMGFSPKDMDWMEGRKMSARDIALAFGVPPIILNIPGDSTFANYKEARLSLYEDTIIPLMDMIRDELNSWLVPRFGENLMLEYDVDSIVALDTKRSEKFTQISSAGFLTTNEKRVALGYEPIDGGDELLVNSGQTTLTDLVSISEDDPALQSLPENNPVNDVEDDEESENESEEQEPQSEDEEKSDLAFDFSHTPIEQLQIKQINPMGKRGRITAWRQVNNARKRLSEAMELDLVEDFKEMAKRIGKETNGLEPRLAEFAALNAIEQSSKQIEQTIRKHFKRATEFFGRTILESGKSLVPVELQTKTARRFSDFLDNYVDSHTRSSITSIENTNLKTARKTIRKLTADAVEEGLSTVDLSKELQSKFTDLATSRATTIARTEISIASNDASIEAAKALDIPDLMKEWVSVNDDRTRPGGGDSGNLSEPNHIVMNGVRVGINEKFTVPPDASMDGPGDDTADAGQVINCRCIMVFSRG